MKGFSFFLIFLFLFNCNSKKSNLNDALFQHPIFLTETAPKKLNTHIPDTLVLLRTLTAQAKKEIDIAGLYFTHSVDRILIKNIRKAAQRGVKVNILLNNSTFSHLEIYKLDFDFTKNINCRFINVSELGYNPYGAYHAKYFIVDKKIAVLGSANFSASALKRNREINLCVSDSKIVHPLYSIFSNDFFLSAQLKTNMRNPFQNKPRFSFTTNVDNLLLETAPFQIDNPSVPNILDALTNLIAMAVTNIKAEMYVYTAAFSNFPYMQTALKQAYDRGVKIQIIFNKRTFDEKTDNGDFKYKIYRDAVQDLLKYGIEIKLIDTQKLFSDQYSTTHSKLMIIDNKFCLVGSNNWSRSAVRENRELAIFTKTPYVLSEALYLFQKDWKFSSPFTLQN